MSASPNCLISSVKDLKSFLSSISQGSTLYIDLEGQNLSRHGTLTLVTILVYPQKTTRIIDVKALGNSAFTTSCSDGRTLKSILEDTRLTKCIWDVRNDADALWAHHRVAIAGVVDIQLLENASRLRDKTRLSSLYNVIRFDVKLGFMERERWLRTKNDIKGLLNADVFTKRPLDAKTIQYCVNDVEQLPGLQEAYMARIDTNWLGKARREMQCRLDEARSPGYEPQSEKKGLGPWGSGLVQSGLLDLDGLEEALHDEWIASPDEDDCYVQAYDCWDEDDGPHCSADVDDFDGAFDSCWTRSP